MARLLPLLLLAVLGALPAYADGAPVRLVARNAEAERVLNQALSQPGYWSGASASTYSDKVWDEIRLKQLESGYLAMISGEGDQDFHHVVVADIVFSKQNQLPRHTSGAKAVVTLGTGTDAKAGVPYTDTFFFLDFDVFYGVYAQRMYRETQGSRTVLWFEKLDSSFVDAATWARYEKKIADTKAAVNTRAILGSIVDVGTIYGMFIVEPGKARESRVTFITKFTFGDEAGWIARWGSQLPPVIKAGLKSGFRSCVDIARAEQLARGG
jgi:hypothetical protein